MCHTFANHPSLKWYMPTVALSLYCIYNVAGPYFFYTHYRIVDLGTNLSMRANGTQAGYSQEPTPLIVLFTTFKTNKFNITINDTRINNTLRAWAELAPRLTPVLYYADNSTVDDAISRGWTAVKCPKIADKISPSCVLPAMFIDAQHRFPMADFYGYANGDLLFDESLFQTLSQVRKSVVCSSLLIVGRRYNYEMLKGETISTVGDVTRRKNKTSRFQTFAIDYFISPRNKYNWTVIPPVVVGRNAYDNFMIAHSIAQSIPVLDATETIFAMHQTWSENNYESRKGAKQYGINYKILRNFSPNEYQSLQGVRGMTSCAPFYSSWNNMTVRITEREKHIQKECQYVMCKCKYVMAGNVTCM